MSAGFLSPPECPLCGGVFVDADVASFAPKLLESVIWGQDYQQARKNDAWARYAMILEKLQLDRCRVAQAYLHAAWAAESKELCGKYLQQSLQAFMDFYESPGFADLSADEAQTIILRISEVNRQLGRFADAIAWAKKMLLHPEFGKGWSGTLLRQSLALAAAENMQPAVAQSQTRLHLAVAEGNDKQLQELLCDDSHLVDEVDRNGMTALMLALQLGRSQAAARILSAGARVDVTDDSGNNALYYAVDGGSLVLAKAVLQRLPAPDSLNGSGVSALHHAVVKNNAAMAKLLLQSGMSPAVRDGNGNSLLHLLAGTASPSMDLAKLLLEVVSDPNQRNFADRTPLHIAVEKGHADLTKLLLKHGASINARTPDGCSSLFFCDADLIGLLIESGADYRLINNQGLSAFAVARI
jgi:ankyrin repeat protein